MSGASSRDRKREFEEAIKKSPEDHELHGVYADWLEEEGDHEEAAYIRSKPEARAFFHVLHRELAASAATKWPALAEEIASIRAETFVGAQDLFDRVELLARITKAPESARSEILEAIATLRAKRLTAVQLDTQWDRVHFHGLTEIVFQTFFSPDVGMPTGRIDPIDGVLTVHLGVASYTWQGGCTAASIDQHDAKALNEYAARTVTDGGPYLFSGEPDTALGRFMTEIRVHHRNPVAGGVSNMSVLALSHFFSDDDSVGEPWRSLLELVAEMIRARLPPTAVKKSLNVALERCKLKPL
jgi:uncharacterized protein (TIGR02996 family)